YQYAGNEAEFHVALETKPDVVLADHTLPGFDGVAALEIVRQRDSRLPFIFVTGSLSEAEAIETFKKGATDYILKDRMSRLRPAGCGGSGTGFRGRRANPGAGGAFAASARRDPGLPVGWANPFLESERGAALRSFGRGGGRETDGAFAFRRRDAFALGLGNDF